MANTYTAVTGERLDTIVQKVLGSLNEFENILKNNPHLQDKMFLNHGDIVNFEIVVKKDFSIKIDESVLEESNIAGSISTESIEIEFKEPLINENTEGNLKALW